MVDVRPGTSKIQRYQGYDKSLELRAVSAATVAASSATSGVAGTGIELPVRQQNAFKAVVNAGTYAATSSETWSIAIQVATASATTATGTTIASYTVPTTGGERELYMGGLEVLQATGDFATLEDPLYVRSVVTSSATNNLTALDYSAFLTCI